jgi:hypothetical protein
MLFGVASLRLCVFAFCFVRKAFQMHMSGGRAIVSVAMMTDD